MAPLGLLRALALGLALLAGAGAYHVPHPAFTYLVLPTWTENSASCGPGTWCFNAVPIMSRSLNATTVLFDDSAADGLLGAVRGLLEDPIVAKDPLSVVMVTAFVPICTEEDCPDNLPGQGNMEAVRLALASGMGVLGVLRDAIDFTGIEYTGVAVGMREPRAARLAFTDYVAAFQVGIEFCRSTAHVGPQRIMGVVLNHGCCQDRFWGFKAGVEQACPEKKHVFLEPVFPLQKGSTYDITSRLDKNVHPLSNEDPAFKSLMTSLFVTEPTISAIVCENDDSAVSVLEAATQARPDKGRGLWVSGFDYTSRGADLVKAGRLKATVDIQYFTPGRGLLYTMPQVLAAMHADRSGKPFGIPDYIETATQIFIPDMAGILVKELVDQHDANVPPPSEGKVNVRVGVSRVQVMTVDVLASTFNGVLALTTKWHDSRLSWDPYIVPHNMRVLADEIWHPRSFVTSTVEEEELHPKTVTVTPDGEVTMTTTVRGGYTCVPNIENFPFDFTTCRITVTVPGTTDDVEVEGSLGFFVSGVDSNFDTDTRIEDARVVDLDGEHDAVSFALCFARKPLAYHLRLFAPSIVLNFIGFLAFWLPATGESIALGVTTLLCTIALRDGILLPETSTFTWVESFMLISLAFQGLVLLMGFIEYSDFLYSQTEKMALKLSRAPRPFAFAFGRLLAYIRVSTLNDVDDPRVHAAVRSVSDGDDLRAPASITDYNQVVPIESSEAGSGAVRVEWTADSQAATIRCAKQSGDLPATPKRYSSAGQRGAIGGAQMPAKGDDELEERPLTDLIGRVVVLPAYCLVIIVAFILPYVREGVCWRTSSVAINI